MTEPKSIWSRREVMKLAGGAAALTLAGPRASFSATSQMIMATGGGKLEEAYRKTIFDPWKEKTGIEIVTTSNQGAKLKAMVEQGQVEWDVMQGPAEQMIVFARQGLLEPIDYSMIDKSKMLPGTMHEHFVLTDVAAYNMAWNTEAVKAKAPQSWADMWAHNGRIGLWKRPYQTFEAALLADGVTLDKLYPLDVDRALASLGKIKDKLVWWERGAQCAQILINNEVDISSVWNGRVYEPKLSGAPVDYNFNQAVFVNDAWGIPKGAPHKKEAMELVAFGLSPKIQAAYSSVIPYGPVNTEALKLLDAKTQAVLPSSEENFKKGILLNLEYWADNGAAVSERFNKWLLG